MSTMHYYMSAQTPQKQISIASPRLSIAVKQASATHARSQSKSNPQETELDSLQEIRRRELIDIANVTIDLPRVNPRTIRHAAAAELKLESLSQANSPKQLIPRRQQQYSHQQAQPFDSSSSSLSQYSTQLQQRRAMISESLSPNSNASKRPLPLVRKSINQSVDISNQSRKRIASPNIFQNASKTPQPESSSIDAVPSRRFCNRSYIEIPEHSPYYSPSGKSGKKLRAKQNRLNILEQQSSSSTPNPLAAPQQQQQQQQNSLLTQYQQHLQQQHQTLTSAESTTTPKASSNPSAFPMSSAKKKHQKFISSLQLYAEEAFSTGQSFNQSTLYNDNIQNRSNSIMSSYPLESSLGRSTKTIATQTIPVFRDFESSPTSLSSRTPSNQYQHSRQIGSISTNQNSNYKSSQIIKKISERSATISHDISEREQQQNNKILSQSALQRRERTPTSAQGSRSSIAGAHSKHVSFITKQRESHEQILKNPQPRVQLKEFPPTSKAKERAAVDFAEVFTSAPAIIPKATTSVASFAKLQTQEDIEALTLTEKERKAQLFLNLVKQHFNRFKQEHLRITEGNSNTDDFMLSKIGNRSTEIKKKEIVPTTKIAALPNNVNNNNKQNNKYISIGLSSLHRMVVKKSLNWTFQKLKEYH